MSINIPFFCSSLPDERVECVPGLRDCVKDNDNILLVGNGFDLALGKQTKYQDYILYLFVVALLKNIELDGDFEKRNFFSELRNFLICNGNNYYEIVNVINIVEKRLDFDDDGCFRWLNRSLEYSFLHMLIVSIFQTKTMKKHSRTPSTVKGRVLHANFITYFDSWFPLNQNRGYSSRSDLLIATRYSETSSEQICKCICNFYDDLSSEIGKNKLYGWLDIECLIEFLVLKDALLENRFATTSAFKNYLSKSRFLNGLYLDIKSSDEIYRSLCLFTVEFCKFVSLQESSEKQIDFAEKFERETAKYKLSVDSCSNRDEIEDVKFSFIKCVTSIIDFNYSSTTQKTFSAYNKHLQKHDIYHVNGKCDNLSAVFGYTNTKQIKVNREAFKFEKRTQRLLKNVPSVDFVKLTSSPFNLFIFGHSCSTADRDILEPLLKSKSLQFVIVFCYSEEDKISIYKNLCEILGYEHMDHLTRQTDSTSQRLLWAIHEDKTTDKS